MGFPTISVRPYNVGDDMATVAESPTDAPCVYLPSPELIAAICQQIQADWSDETRMLRSAYVDYDEPCDRKRYRLVVPRKRAEL